VVQGGVSASREGFPLRPELIESIMYLYRATGDPWLVEAGLDILRSIQHSARTPCGYATIKNVRDHSLADRMESFFLAETTKYLYLLFDPENFLHNRGNIATVVDVEGQGECVLDAGGYIFNTEAHPIDPAALACCSGLTERELTDQLATQIIDILNPGAMLREWQGDLVPERLKKLEKKREKEAEERRQRERAARERMEELLRQANAKGKPTEPVTKEAGVITNNDTDFEEEEEEEATGTEGIQNEQLPEFSLAQEPGGEASSEVTEHSEEMITLVSRGELEVVETEPGDNLDRDDSIEGNKDMSSESTEGPKNESGEKSPNPPVEEADMRPGIVQPANMVNEFEKKKNLLVSAISNLMEKFLPVESRQFDIQAFSNKLKNDETFPLTEGWDRDYEALSCPAVKFTDRFLFHGEFFVQESPGV